MAVEELIYQHSPYHPGRKACQESKGDDAFAHSQAVNSAVTGQRLQPWKRETRGGAVGRLQRKREER